VGMKDSRFIESPFGAEIVIDGRTYVNFAGSSYLGLAGKPEILEAGVEALRACGSGYQLARQYNIVTMGHREAEIEAANYFGSEAALYLAGGYYFGLVAVPAIREQFGAIFLDEGCRGRLGFGHPHLSTSRCRRPSREAQENSAGP
jgi:8-amino-7-oxononanoate synthase